MGKHCSTSKTSVGLSGLQTQRRNLYWSGFKTSRRVLRSGNWQDGGKPWDRMVGIKRLTIGYIKDVELAKKVARATGVRRLSIQTCLEGHTLNLNEEVAKCLDRFWRLERKTAYKTQVVVVMERRLLAPTRKDE